MRLAMRRDTLAEAPAERGASEGRGGTLRRGLPSRAAARKSLGHEALLLRGDHKAEGRGEWLAPRDPTGRRRAEWLKPTSRGRSVAADWPHGREMAAPVAPTPA